MNKAQVSEFFKFFFGKPLQLAAGSIDLKVNKEQHYGGWFDESTGAPVSGHGAIPIPLNPDVLFCTSSAVQYPTLHVCLNNTDLKGRKTENMRSCNVICLDIDREIEREEVRAIQEKWGCGLIVESSPRKYHFYWKLSNSVPLDRWSKYQLAFASKFGGDKALRIVTAMIRVPGFSRITKKGIKFEPAIIYRAPYSECVALDEASLLRKFPWIPGEIEKGEESLAGEYAYNIQNFKKFEREFSKATESANGKSLDLSTIEAGAGRNNFLYWSVKKQVIESNADQDEIMEFGAQVNQAFGTPLPGLEAMNCVLSGWKHGLAIRSERENREIKLLEDLAVVTETHINGSASTSQITENSSNGSAASASKQENKSARSKLKIPRSMRHAATKMAMSVWREDKDLAIGVVTDALLSKNYQGFADWFCAKWVLVGAIRASGPVLFLRGESKWNAPVGYACAVPRDVFLGFVASFVNEIWKLSKLKKFKKKKKTKDGSRKKAKTPSHSTMLGLGDAAWKRLSLQACTPRQSSDIVVFQNGVFNLTQKTFEFSERASALYSHALWASFCTHTEAKYREIRESAANAGWSAHDTVKTMLMECCPRFYGYMQNWFPGDMLTAVSILRYFGYCLTTDFGQQKFTFFYGPTRAGKGSLCRILCGIVGDNNYASVNYASLDGGFSFSGMHDKLVISMEEVEAKQGIHEPRLGILKKLVGGERVTFERKYQHPFEDYFIGKFVLQSNEPLRYNDRGHSVRSRMLVYGFEQTFEETPGPDPAVIVLGNENNTESGAIATLAALFWAECRHKPNPFKVEGSRAIKVGTEQVTDSINIVGTTLKKYFIADTKGTTELDLFHKVVLYAADSKGIKLHEHRPGIVAQLNLMIERELPFALIRKSLGRQGKHGSGKRGYVGVKFDQNSFLKDFPDAESELEDGIIVTR